MTTPLSSTGESRRERLAAATLPFVVVLALAPLLSAYADEIARGGEGWKTGDWLINYHSGLIRRGLAGTGFFWLDDLGLPLLWSVFAVNTLIYVATYALVLAIYRSRARGVEWLLFLLSPAFLLFPAYDLQGGFRKETIIFLAFAGLALAYARGQAWRPATVAALVLFGAGCFSHEVNAFALPFFLFLLWKGHTAGLASRATSVLLGLAFSALAVAAVLIAMAAPGDAQMIVHLCRSLEARGLDPAICVGAISDLDKGPAYFRMQLMHFGGGASYLRTYGLLLFLSVLPLTLLHGARRDLRALMLVGFVALLPLFTLAIDWGRWIHLYVFLIFCAVLAESARHHDVRVRRVPLAFGIAYLVSWSLPHCCAAHLGQGFWGSAFTHLSRVARLVADAAMLQSMP